MARITLENFAKVSRGRWSGEVRVDINTGGLKARRDNRFNRAIRWFRSKWSGARPDPRVRQAEVSSAHNAFLRAISDDFYSAHDIAEARKKLEASHYLGSQGSPEGETKEQGLSSRLVREIIGDLRKRESSVRRNITMTAHHLAEMKTPEGGTIGNYLSRTIEEMVSERPRLREMGYQMGKERKQVLSQRIFDAIMGQIDEEGSCKLKQAPRVMREGQATADRLVNEALDEEEQRLFPPQEQAMQTEAGQPEEARLPERQQELSQGRQQELSHLLKEKKIPDGKALQRQLQAVGRMVDGSPEDIRLVNEHTGAWIEENRLQAWYSEAFPEEAAAAPVPQQLQDQVGQALAKHKAVMSYDQAKAQTRAIVKNYVDTHYAESLPGQLAGAKLPESVDQHLAALIKSGDVTDSASLGKQGNAFLAEWVKENRVGKWYRQSLEHEGVEFKGAQVIPRELMEDVTEAISGRDQLWSYDLLKTHARRIVDNYVTEEVAEGIYGTRV